jgi:hypothetical protein
MSGELVPLYVIIFCFVDDVCPASLLLLLVVFVRPSGLARELLTLL